MGNGPSALHALVEASLPHIRSPIKKGAICHVIHWDKNSSDSLLSTVAPHTGPSIRFWDKSSLSNWRELSSIFLFSYDTALSLLVLGF